jgi:type VI secretion system protein ImpL
MVLHKHFNTVRQSLKQLKINGRSAWDLPLYLVVGMPHAGKSTVLAQSGLEFFLADALVVQTPAGMTTAGHVNWWVTRSAVFIDVPGYYLQTPAFSELLSLIKKNKPIHGVLITLDLAELALQCKGEREISLQQFKQPIQEIVQQLGEKFSVYLLFNKIDSMSGFSHFFNELSQEERTQPWGIAFSTPGMGNPAHILTCFSTEYDRLLARLNERLIWLLHQERDLENRPLIKDFPLQIEALKPLIAGFMYVLSEVTRHSPHIVIRGLYLCSGLQSEAGGNGNEPINCLLPTLKQYFELSPTSADAVTGVPGASGKRQAYFINQLFNSIILAEAESESVVPEIVRNNLQRGLLGGLLGARKKQYMTYAGAVLVVLAASTYAFKGYQQQIQRIEIAKQAIIEYKQLTQRLPQSHADNMLAVLPALNTLHQADQQLSGMKLPWLFSIVSDKYRQTMNAVPQLYQQTLQMQFIPGLKHILEEQLSSQRVMDPRYGYPALKTYLMLGQPAHLQGAQSQRDYFKAWFIRDWQSRFKTQRKVQEQLRTYLDVVLDKSWAPVPLNALLINQNRQLLSMVPEPMLAYMMLQDQVKQQTPEYLLAKDMLGAEGERTVFVDPMLMLYTRVGFDVAYNKTIPMIVKQVMETDFVLGEKQAAKNRPSSGLVQAVRDLYLIDYSKIWHKFESRLALKSTRDLQQIERVLNELTKTPSPLLSIVNVITENTTLLISNPPPEAPNINEQFKEIKALLTKERKPAKLFQDTLTQLDALHKYIAPIVRADNLGKAALEAVGQRVVDKKPSEHPLHRLQKQAERLPEPLQGWVKNIVTQSWTLILKEANVYLNTTWKKEISVFYSQQLQNRYPLNKTGDKLSEKNIALSDFTEFFSKDGRLNKYVETHLKPFIDTSTPRWQWRQLDGKAILNISDDVLLQLQRAAVIRKMYFNEKEKLAVPLKIQPVSVGPQIKEVILQMGSKKMDLTPRPGQLSTVLSWPEGEKAQLTSQDIQNRDTKLDTAGPWAFFRLLDKGQLQHLSGPNHFEWSVEINGQTAQYEIMADKAINPLIIGIVDQFQLPEVLTK